MITQCTNQENRLTRTSRPIIVATPGYPSLYNISEMCNSVVRLGSGLINSQISIVDRHSPGLNSYLCGTIQVEVHLLVGTKKCPRLSTATPFPNAAAFIFHFYAHLRQIRGILFEITAGKVFFLQDAFYEYKPCDQKYGKSVYFQAFTLDDDCSNRGRIDYLCLTFALE